MSPDIVILGVFVADTAYRAARQPKIGETILGTAFALGPGGKGSNQAIAAARAGGNVAILSKLGEDDFANLALQTWAESGVTPVITRDASGHTGAAYIFVEDATGNNAIIISPGVAAGISAADVKGWADLIGQAKVFVTQLEQPVEAAQCALRVARDAGVTTVLNPAPAAVLSDDMLALVDYITPNETEAEGLTGQIIATPAEAAKAARALMARGVGRVIITLGENGVLYHDGTAPVHVNALNAGSVAETTGAGDAFNGGFAAALAEGKPPAEAVRFANAAAALSVTRPGTATSMPGRAEIDALLAQG
ncbi:MAG: ribokinase [Rhodobacteraceae bacterium]|nr:ribokinase [Paracoccaceae bacterium]